MNKPIIANDLGANNTIKEAWLSLYLLCTPRFLYSQNLLKAQSTFALTVSADPSDIYLVDSGRTALALVLKSLNLNNTTSVLLQAFSCIVVPNAVLQAGLVPIICDVDTTYNIELDDALAKLVPSTKILIIQHTMGSLCNMDKVIEFCTKHQLILIEDCAHSLGCTYVYKNKPYPVGSLSAASIYSFGRDKVVSTTIGGAIQINNSQLFPGISKNLQELKTISFGKEFRALSYIVLCVLLVRPLYYFFSIGKFLLYTSQRLRLVEPVYSLQEKEVTNKLEYSSRYSPKLAVILLSQLNNVPSDSRHRTIIAQTYAKYLTPHTESSNNFRFLLDVDSTKYASIIKVARYNENVLVGKWYTSVFLPFKNPNLSLLNYFPGLTSTAEFFASNRSINLPTNKLVTIERATSLALAIKSLL